MTNKDVRKGKGIQWVLETHFGESRGFTVDNLDTKSMGDAENDFERLFVTIRKVLENRESFCLDNEEERLQVCQDLAENIKQEKQQIFR